MSVQGSKQNATLKGKEGDAGEGKYAAVETQRLCGLIYTADERVKLKFARHVRCPGSGFQYQENEEKSGGIIKPTDTWNGMMDTRF